MAKESCFPVAGEQFDKIHQDNGVGLERNRRAPDQQIATRTNGKPCLLPGWSDDGALRIQSVSTIQEVLGHRVDGRLAKTGSDDQSYLCTQCR